MRLRVSDGTEDLKKAAVAKFGHGILFEGTFELARGGAKIYRNGKCIGVLSDSEQDASEGLTWGGLRRSVA